MHAGRRILGVAASVRLGLLLTGCAQVTGGGTIASAGHPGAKASFGFDVTCNENNRLVGTWV